MQPNLTKKILILPKKGGTRDGIFASNELKSA